MICSNCYGDAPAKSLIELETRNGEKLFFCQIKCADAYVKKVGMRVVKAEGKKK